MTLATSALIPRPIPVEELFQFVREDLLGGTDAHKWTHGPQRWRREPNGDLEYCSYGVGLASIVEVRYRPDSALDFSQEYADEAEDGPYDDPRTYRPRGKFYAELHLDTAYGYQGVRLNSSCNDLHAWILHEVGGWLAERGCDNWTWHHEYQGWWLPPSEIGLLGDPEKGRLTDEDRRSYGKAC